MTLRLIKKHSYYLTYECGICFKYTEVSIPDPSSIPTPPPFCPHCQTDRYRWYYGLGPKPDYIEAAQCTELVDPDR